MAVDLRLSITAVPFDPCLCPVKIIVYSFTQNFPLSTVLYLALKSHLFNMVLTFHVAIEQGFRMMRTGTAWDICGCRIQTAAVLIVVATHCQETHFLFQFGKNRVVVSPWLPLRFILIVEAYQVVLKIIHCKTIHLPLRGSDTYCCLLPGFKFLSLWHCCFRLFHYIDDYHLRLHNRSLHP